MKHRAVCTACPWTGDAMLLNAAARDAGEHREETGHTAKVERAAATDGGVDQSDGEIHQIDCPECDWESRKFDDIRGELATKVDAEMHYVEDHGGRIPDDAPFGEYQCPECFDTHGLHRTVSCSECGFIPDGVRA